MRLSVEYNIDTVVFREGAGVDPASREAAMHDPSAPDLGFLTRDVAAALASFFATIDRITADNPVAIARLQALAARSRLSPLTEAETEEFQLLKLHALRQGRAVGAVIGFFLKFKPFETLAEIRQKVPVFQPPFGPVLVVDGAAVRDVLERNQDFSVEPYGVEMMKVMTPAHNGGFNTFILSTDDTSVYEPDKRLLTAVCTRQDADTITELIHQDCVRRVGAALSDARANGSSTIDVVPTLARYVPVTMGHRYLGVPVAPQRGSFDLTPEMLTYYGEPIEGLPGTELTRRDGIIPNEQQMYLWIKAAFQHFFNNVQKDPAVKVQGLRACRELLVYLLREISIQRQRLLDGRPVDDTMLTRLVQLQMGRPTPSVQRPQDFDPRLVSDLRIAENVMGTIVGAIAGQEEATCRAIDSLIRLQEGEYRTSGSRPCRYGNFSEAKELAVNVLSGKNAKEGRATLHKYFLEALRLQPQGEVLLRKCAREGAQIAGGPPLSAGSLVFASHGSAMKHVPEPDAFILDRPREHYLQHGWSRHTCLGQHVSPVISVESMIALLGLQDLARPEPRRGESSFPFERRFGRLQLDDQNLYATTFSLRFADAGTTRRFWPAVSEPTRAERPVLSERARVEGPARSRT
jgi:cytochrome P450